MTVRVGQVRAFNKAHTKKYSDQGGAPCAAVRVVSISLIEITLAVETLLPTGAVHGYALGREWGIPVRQRDSWLEKYTDIISDPESLFRRKA